MEARNGMLYPLMVIAAISVIVLSFFGIAAMTGHIPAAQSQQKAVVTNSDAAQPAASGNLISQRAAQSGPCSSCGIVESIRVADVRVQPAGIGAVAGGVPGSQVGNGNGRTAATIVGAAGVAYVGNNVEKDAKRTTLYVIRVRLDDGTHRIAHDISQPPVNVGERVKVSKGTVVASG